MEFSTQCSKWNSLLKHESEKQYFKNIIKFIILESTTKTIFPPRHQIFRIFDLDYDKVKVVFLGQDPYHGRGQANGLSFSVNKGIKIPPSLKNIFLELENDLNLKPPVNGDLTPWFNQGVFLYNTVLSVEESKPFSHKDIGWLLFSEEVVSFLNKRNTPIVFILLGASAKQYKHLITNKNHYILESTHPSPFSCHKGFFGSKIFSKTNTFLEQKNLEPINWKIDFF